MEDIILNNFDSKDQFWVLATAEFRKLFALREISQQNVTRLLDNLDSTVQTCDPDRDLVFYVDCLKEVIWLGGRWYLSRASCFSSQLLIAYANTPLERMPSNH